MKLHMKMAMYVIYLSGLVEAARSPSLSGIGKGVNARIGRARNPGAAPHSVACRAAPPPAVLTVRWPFDHVVINCHMRLAMHVVNRNESCSILGV